MSEMNHDQFIEEVETLLLGYITDKDTATYLAFKIGRIHEKYSERESED